MAYQTGTASDIYQLLNKLESFAVSLGWQIDDSYNGALLLHNNEGYWSIDFDSSNKQLFVYANTGYDRSKNTGSQPGSQATKGNAVTQVKTATSHLDSGNYTTYDFLGTGDYLHVVVQIEPNRFRHFGFGTVVKEGEYVGGQYAFGTYLDDYIHYNENTHCFGFSTTSNNNYAAVVRADGVSADVRSPWYFSSFAVSDYSYLDKSKNGNYVLCLGRAAMPRNANAHHPEALLVSQSQSVFGQRLIPQPNSLMAHGLDGVFYRLGTLPDRYECTMRGISPRQILTINDERWMIIPSAGYDERNQYQIEQGKDNSGIQGVAYRIVD